MALDHLVAILRHEAEAEAESILAAARGEASAIRARSESELAARRATTRGAREAEQRSAVELALASARHEARRTVFQARDRLVARIFAAIRARLPGALGGAAYRALLPGQVAEALRCLGSRKGVLQTHPAIADLVRAGLAGSTRVKLETQDIVGSGFRLLSADGALEIHATLEDRLTRETPRIALAVLKESGHSP